MGSLWESPQGVLGPVKDECLAGPASSVAKAPSAASVSVIQVNPRAAQRCWASSKVDDLPRRRLGRTYRLYGRWNLSACVANAVGHHIVLTRRETGGLRRSHATGHVGALHLMDRWSTGWILVQSAVNNVDDLAQMDMPARMDGVRSVAKKSSMVDGRIAGEMVRGSMMVLRAVCLRL